VTTTEPTGNRSRLGLGDAAGEAVGVADGEPVGPGEPEDGTGVAAGPAHDATKTASTSRVMNRARIVDLPGRLLVAGTACRR
jgi:hypothetical protein